MCFFQNMLHVGFMTCGFSCLYRQEVCQSMNVCCDVGILYFQSCVEVNLAEKACTDRYMMLNDAREKLPAVFCSQAGYCLQI